MDVFTREVTCSNCGDTTRFPTSILKEIVQGQSETLPGATYINYACPRCKALTRSPLAPAVNVVRDTDRSRLLDGLEIYVVSLQCAQDDCESHVIALAAVMIREAGGLGVEDHAQMIWHNRSARCTNNHAPRHPIRILGWLNPPK